MLSGEFRHVDIGDLERRIDEVKQAITAGHDAALDRIGDACVQQVIALRDGIAATELAGLERVSEEAEALLNAEDDSPDAFVARVANDEDFQSAVEYIKTVRETYNAERDDEPVKADTSADIAAEMLADIRQLVSDRRSELQRQLTEQHAAANQRIEALLDQRHKIFEAKTPEELDRVAEQISHLIEGDATSATASFVDAVDDSLAKAMHRKYTSALTPPTVLPELTEDKSEKLKAIINDDLMKQIAEQRAALLIQARMKKHHAKKAASSSAVKTTTPDPSKSTESRFFIFADWKDNPDRSPIAFDDLFDSSNPEEPLITINYQEAELEPDQYGQLVSDQGLRVVSPSEMEYTLTKPKDDKPPVAILTQADAAKKLNDTETEAQHKQRLTLTIMNMIDNVVSKSNIVNVTTSDPFVAEVAKSYIYYLQTTQDLYIDDQVTLRGADQKTEARKEAEKDVKQLFDDGAKFKETVTEKIKEDPAWFKAAKKFRIDNPSPQATKAASH
jgi:hypothetical protein